MLSANNILWNFAWVNFVNDCLCKFIECFLNIISFLCRSFNKQTFYTLIKQWHFLTMFLCEKSCVCRFHLSFMFHILFVPKDHKCCLLPSELLYFGEPCFNPIEWVLSGYIVDYQNSNRTSKVASSDRFKSFLSRSIPYLKSDCFTIDFLISHSEFDAYCMFDLWVELTFQKTIEYARFSDSCFTDDNVLKQIINFFLRLELHYTFFLIRQANYS